MIRDQERGEKIALRLQESDFAHLRSKAETQLLRELIKGSLVEVDCASIAPQSGADPRSPLGWDPCQEIRGGLVRWACLQIVEFGDTTAGGLTISAARFVESDVDLSEIRTPLIINFQWCRFEKRPDLSEAHFASLSLERSFVPSLFAKAVTIDGELVMTGFLSKGKISLERASIGGDLDLSQSAQVGFEQKLLGSVLGEDRAVCNPANNQECNLILNCQNIRVGGSIYLDGSIVWGLIDFTGAQILADFDFGACHLHGLGNACLILEKVQVSGQLFFEESFFSDGEVRLSNCVIKNGLSAEGASFRSTGASDGIALRIENSRILGATTISGIKTACDIEGLSLNNSVFDNLTIQAVLGSSQLDLRDAKAIKFTDFLSNWPQKGHLHLGGFVYSRILLQIGEQEPEVQAEQRLKWLKLDTGNPTQPYMQLSHVLQEQGFDDEATDVMEQLASRKLGKSLKGDVTWVYGYGYDPLRVIGFMGLLTGIGFIIYRRAHLQRAITPTEREAYDEFKSERGLPAHYPSFSPAIYSLENTFPLVNLGQASKWQPDPAPFESPDLSELGLEPNGSHLRAVRIRAYIRRALRTRSLRLFLWFQIVVGWVLATFFVAGLADLIHK